MVGWHHSLNGHEFEQAPIKRKPGKLQSMGLQRVGHNRVTEQQKKPMSLKFEELSFYFQNNE